MAFILEQILTGGIAKLSYLTGYDAEGVAAVLDSRADVDCDHGLARVKMSG